MAPRQREKLKLSSYPLKTFFGYVTEKILVLVREIAVYALLSGRNIFSILELSIKYLWDIDTQIYEIFARVDRDLVYNRLLRKRHLNSYPIKDYTGFKSNVETK